MGQSSSKTHSDPAVYATSFKPGISSIVSEDERAQWKSYDYVIVGGGTAGCVLASRLSEDRGTTVLLLEAGESNEGLGKFFSRIPLAFERILGTPHDWQYQTVPQKEFTDERTVDMQRGKLLGGTSSINAMIYHHCDPEDYEAWERLGATGWGSSTMSKYFQKMKRDGLRVSDNLELAPITNAFIDAAVRMGIPRRKDFNTAEGGAGAGAFFGAVDGAHERSSTATTYLRQEVRDRPNLTIAVCAHTERVLFTAGAGGAPKAVGVQISSTRDGPKYAVGANREVLVCGGAIGSPQVLLLSGIGPAEQLNKVEVPVVLDLPKVGRGLLDQVSPGGICFRAKPGWTWDYIVQSPLHGALALFRWLAFGSGPMGALCAQAAVFTRSDDESLPYGPELPVTDTFSGPRAPDLEFLLFPVGFIEFGHASPPRGTNSVTVASILLKPVSAGTVELRTNSVYDAPLIDTNFLAEQSDMNACIRAVRFLLHLARTPPLADALDLRHFETAPEDADYYWIGDADPDKVSDAEIEAYARRWGQSSAHPTSSVRMGQDPAKSAVDLQLRVHGVQSLRVIDASVFPDQVSGHPCVPVIAVAERAADLIKGDA